MATIKITQLPGIGNGLSASTILPVVDTSGTAITAKVTVGNVANFALTQAGNTLPPAFLANVAYSVANAAQPNITSVGNLTGLTLTNLANFHIPGGTNGYVLQTDGTGNLSWTAQTGNAGNGTPGGSNSQLQFNLSGSFAGDPELTWDAGNNQLNTVNFAASSATIYGNVNAVNVNATGNIRPNAIYTDHYYYANGYVFGGGGGNGTPGGSNTQIQFNDGGVFGGNTGFTFNKTTGIFTSPYLAGNGNGLSNIQGANISGFVPNANVANTAFAVAGANVSGQVSYAALANSVAVANVVGIGNIATLALDGNSSNVLYGNGVFDSVGSPFNQDLNTTDNVTFANITTTDAIRFSNSSNIVGALGYAPNYVSIEGYGSNAVNITANDIYTWTFDGNGNLTIPNGGYINFVNTGGIKQVVNEDFYIRGSDDEEDGWAIFNIIDDGAGNQLTKTQLQYNRFSVYTDVSGNNYSFDFRDTGEFDVPKSIRGPFGGNLVISIGDQFGSNTFIDLQTRSYVGDALISNIRIANPNVTVSTASGAYNWTFGDTGLLTFPGTPRIATDTNNFEVQAAENINFEANTVVNIYTDTSNNAYQWQFGDDGNLTLPGNTFSVNYANGVQVSIGGGGNVSELVNGNNSFVLDSAGNVVFEGTPSGNAVDRGLVWDYGANANGVNSMIRQDLNGLTVRAWTENGGNYIAPVNIITGQDANTNTWRFDGQGNLTVPSGSINSINDGGDIGAYLTLTPNIGLVRLTGREAQSSVNYTNTAWTSATYTGTQIDFVDSPQLVDFFNTNRFNVGVNQTISINGDEPIPFTGYTTSVGNAVIVYTSVTADPDPTTVTSIDFYYQLESYIAVDYDDGTLNVNATSLTINIDNDQTSGPDINIRSGDDILLQAKDKALGSESEGGDINILAGDGADDDGAGNISSTGGDIQITAGNGGDGNINTGSAGGFTQIYGGTGGAAGVANTAGPGGYVSINGGDGGYDNGNTQLGAGGGYVSINAGLSTQEGVNGPNVTITSGQGGPNALAGSVVISTPASVDGPGGDWVFDGYGNLILPNNSNIATIGNVTQFNTCSNGFLGLNSYDAGGNNVARVNVNSIDKIVSIGLSDPITEIDYNWTFDDTGNLTLPGNTFAVNYANGAPVSIGGGGNTGNVTFDNVTVQGVNGLNLSAGADFTANLAYLQVRAGDVASHIHLDTGNNEAYDLILGDDQNYVQVSSTGNILLSSYDSNTAQYTWTLDYNGNLILAGGNSVIQSIANSSLDPTLPNVSTMVLTPDANYNSQVLVLDPTAPGHIHLRAYAFSNIDEPAANIFLGGEDTAFEITSGANNEARIHSAGNTWTFGTDSTTTVPGHINAITNNSISLNAYDNGAGPTVQMINWNSGSGTPTTIISSEVTEAVITTNVNATPYSWTFDNTGNLTIPGSLIAVTASPSPTLNGFSITNSMGISGNGNISTAGTITATGKIGYSTGGNATQTSTGQGVTINQLTGLVTLANRTYNAGDLEAFSISCNKVSNNDFVLVQMVDSVNAPSYNVVAYPNFVLANTISVLVKTLETVGTDTPILKFMIVKAPIA